jgi:hypothetical protein
MRGLVGTGIPPAQRNWRRPLTWGLILALAGGVLGTFGGRDWTAAKRTGKNCGGDSLSSNSSKKGGPNRGRRFS